MRLGGVVYVENQEPESWAAAVRAEGYGAAYCPVDEKADDATLGAFANAAKAADIVIAEVGAWSNPISPDDDERRTAIKLCQERLALADRIGARCCVNIAGSRGTVWDGPSPDNLTAETFDLIVESVCQIIDGVSPTRTYYTLETMPWAYPISADSYLALIQAIDRDRFAVHLDPTNLINSPERYYGNAAIIQNCFQKLGPWIKSCHAKDIVLSDKLTVHLDETVPGTGNLDYALFLRELNRLPVDTTLMIEHLRSAEQYRTARDYILHVAGAEGIAFS